MENITKDINILIVDDNEPVASYLCAYMIPHNIRSDIVKDGEAMRQALATSHYDLMLLTLNLPGEDGLNLCQQVRANSDLPIIILSVRGELADRVVGLELGADDYLVKPVEPRELIARIHSVLRRTFNSARVAGATAPALGNEISFDGWILNAVRRQLVSPQQAKVNLSHAECRLLSIFLERPRRVMSREQLLDATSGRTSEAFDRSIDLLVSRLRQKLESDPKAPKFLKTVRGEGYVFDAHVIR